MKFTKQLFSMLLIALLLFSCSGEDGADGLDGKDGVAGADGADGADGVDGADGNANVIYSEWMPANFIFPGAHLSNVMGLEVLHSSEFNPATDVVLVYGQRETEEGSTDGVYLLPYILSSQDEYYGSRLLETGTGYSLQVYVQGLNGSSHLFTYFTSYRYVIIPAPVNPKSVGAKSVETNKGKPENIDYTKMSYEDIIAYFDIPN